MNRCAFHIRKLILKAWAIKFFFTRQCRFVFISTFLTLLLCHTCCCQHFLFMSFCFRECRWQHIIHQILLQVTHLLFLHTIESKNVVILCFFMTIFTVTWKCGSKTKSNQTSADKIYLLVWKYLVVGYCMDAIVRMCYIQYKYIAHVQYMYVCMYVRCMYV